MRINVIGPNSKRYSVGGIEYAAKRLCTELNRQGHQADLNGKDDISTYDVYDIHFGFSKRFLKKVKKRSTAVVHAHAQPADMVGGVWGFRFLKFAITPYFRSYYNKAPSIITPSQFAVDSLRGLGIEVNMIEPISNGLPLEKFPMVTENSRSTARENLVTKHGLPPNKSIVGGLGSLFPRKGIKDMVEIAKEMPEIEFIWVGKAQASYPRWAVMRSLGKLPDNFRFLGYIDDIMDFYHGIDLCFIPSYIEMQGLTNLEAAASGCPMLLRDIPVYNWLKDGVNCMKGSSNEEFKDKIHFMLNHVTTSMISKASQDVKSHDIKLTSKKVITHYQKAVDGEFS